MGKIKSAFVLIKKVLRKEYPVNQLLYYYFFNKKYERVNWVGKLLIRSEKKKIPANNRFIPLLYDTKLYLEQYNHPDIHRFQVGNQSLIVMSLTGYPFNDERYENVCVFYSYDGIKFNSFSDNPVQSFSPANNKVGHLSDSEILDNFDNFALIWRESNTIDKEDCLNVSFTDDFINYSDSLPFLKSKYNEILSPSFVRTGNSIMMFSVNALTDDFKMEKRVFEKDLLDIVSCEECAVEGIPDGYLVWHIDIIDDLDGGYHALFTLAKGAGGKDAVLYYGHSCDESGKKWRVGKRIELLSNQQSFFEKVYRSSMLKTEKAYDLYVSVKTHRHSWFTYLFKDFVPKDYF